MLKSKPKEKNGQLNPKIEKILVDIDSGKGKTTTHTVDEYLNYISKVLSE